jgi:hypothetical protein
VAAIGELFSGGGQIDPDDMFQGFGSLMTLDTLGIYGSQLYQLWNDVCKRDLGKMIAVLRAYQLGQLAGATETAIKGAIPNRGRGLDLDAIVAAVQERLPNFRVNALAPPAIDAPATEATAPE